MSEFCEQEGQELEFTPDMEECDTPAFDASMLINVLDKDVLDNVSFDAKEFQKGVKEYSAMAGKITVLVNCGLSPEAALTYIMTTESNLVNKEMNIEMAKFGAFAKEKESV